MNPLRDWSIGLIFAVVLFIGGVTMTLLDFYFQLVSPEIPEISEKPLIYRQNEVVEYAEIYNQKVKDFNAARYSQEYVPPPETPTESDIETDENDPDDLLDEEGLAEEALDE